MLHRSHARAALISLALFTIVCVSMIAGTAHAGQIENPDRQVNHLVVTYVEPRPTESGPSRQYFELNSGSTYVFRNYRHCYNGSSLPHRVCKTVFWYAR